MANQQDEVEIIVCFFRTQEYFLFHNHYSKKQKKTKYFLATAHWRNASKSTRTKPLPSLSSSYSFYDIVISFFPELFVLACFFNTI